MSASFEDRGSLPALGFLELSSISRGLYLTDVILKKAPVRVMASQPISSGKHILLYMGDVASVEESHRAGIENADGCLVRDTFIPAIHAELVPFLDAYWLEGKELRKPTENSLCIIESVTLSGAILSADRALKEADVRLCRMRLGNGIGGKAYYVLTGKQDETEAAAAAARAVLETTQSLGRVDLIARPQEEALGYF